jgi:spermidine/putrescine transport system ATP-binding protein
MKNSNSEKSAFKGEINNIVYFGTDTHFHLNLKTGEDFTIRKQNTPNEGNEFEVGSVVELIIDQDAIQILND